LMVMVKVKLRKREFCFFLQIITNTDTLNTWSSNLTLGD
jgi:hypothetical protein